MNSNIIEFIIAVGVLILSLIITYFTNHLYRKLRFKNILRYLETQERLRGIHIDFLDEFRHTTSKNATNEYQELYEYVKENIGTGNIEFKTKVTKEEFRNYLKNYPGEVKPNAFMGYADYYDFEKMKDGDSHYDYKVARHYIDYGADDYYLPTINS